MRVFNFILQRLGIKVILVSQHDLHQIRTTQAGMVRLTRAMHEHRVLLAETIEALTENFYEDATDDERKVIDHINNTNAEQLPLAEFQISEWEKRFCKDE